MKTIIHTHTHTAVFNFTLSNIYWTYSEPSGSEYPSTHSLYFFSEIWNEKNTEIRRKELVIASTREEDAVRQRVQGPVKSKYNDDTNK